MGKSCAAAPGGQGFGRTVEHGDFYAADWTPRHRLAREGRDTARGPCRPTSTTTAPCVCPSRRAGRLAHEARKAGTSSVDASSRATLREDVPGVSCADASCMVRLAAELDTVRGSGKARRRSSAGTDSTI